MEKQAGKKTIVKQERLTQPGTIPIFIDLFNFSRNPDNTILNISACYKFDGFDINEPTTSRFVEHTRLAITTEHAKRTLDVLARLLGYYPQKPETPPPAKEDAPKAKK